MKNVQFQVALVTVPDAPQARNLAKALVEAKLAACVNILPQVSSYYHWEGKLEETTEHLLVIKTRAGLGVELAQFIKERHSAKVPEVILLPIVEGDRPYLEWLGANTRSARPEEGSPVSL